VAEQVQLVGTHIIRIGHNTVIHPRSKLNSTLGPITIGESCIINERTLIAAPNEAGITIEDGVVVETNAVVEASTVGEGVGIEVGVRIGKGAIVGRNSKLCPLTRVENNEEIPENTIIYGSGQRRVDGSGSAAARRKVTEKQIEGLRALIPSHAAKHMI